MADTPNTRGQVPEGVLLTDWVNVAGNWYRPDSLDAAWAEAEAALPEGWFLVLSDDPRYSAEATREGYHDPAIGWVGVQTRDATGPTPAAALRALAARLRDVGIS